MTEEIPMPQLPTEFFRTLSPDEEEDFRACAHKLWRENKPPNFETYHPVLRDEWSKIDAQFQNRDVIKEGHFSFFECDVCQEMVLTEILDTVWVHGIETIACEKCREGD